MPGVTFQTDDSALNSSLERYLVPWLDAKLSSIAALAVELCPVGVALEDGEYAPGFLRDSHTTEIEGSGLGLVGRVTANAPYALFVHDGTQPHDIYPKNPGGFLRFPTKAGTIVYTKHVSHPGTRAQPWLKDAAAQVISISSGP